MTYKGYTASLTGVYKLERGAKRHSLQIRNAEDKVVYESAHIYEDKEEAFEAAKKIIKQALEKQELGTEEIESFFGLVYKKEKRQPSDIWVKINWTKIKYVAHIINSFTVIALVMLHISQFFFLDFEMDRNREFMILMGSLYAIMGLLMALIMGFWGIFARAGGYTLSGKQQKAWSIIWWLNLIFNKGPVVRYKEQPLEKEPGWYSSTPLIELLFEGMFSCFLLYYGKGYLFVSTIITLALMVLNYFMSIVWEVADAKEKYKEFPWGRVLTPVVTILVLVTVAGVYAVWQHNVRVDNFYGR